MPSRLRILPLAAAASLLAGILAPAATLHLPADAGGAVAADPAPPDVMSIIPLGPAGGVGEPWGTAFDAAGNLWFAEPGCDFTPTCPAGTAPGQLGEIPAGSRTPVFFTLPSISGNQPIFVALDSAGEVWFTTPNNSMIGAFDPASGAFVGQWPVTAGSGPWGLTITAGAIWYTEYFASAIGRFDPLNHSYTDFPTPSADSRPYGITASGTLIWFTENNSSVARIGALDTANGDQISEYLIRAHLPGDLTPHMITVDASGDVWWSEGWERALGRLHPGAASPGVCGAPSGECQGVTEYPLPAPPSSCHASHLSGVAVDSAGGRVWTDDSLAGQVGYLDLASGNYTLYSTPGCGDHPHDGLTLDSTNHAWWDEEFANAIGALLADTDGDTVADIYDNCPTVYNPAQTNTDAGNAAMGLPGSDGLGDACDPDADGDGYTNADEQALGKNPLAYCAVMRADLNGDGVVNLLDLALLAKYFGQAVPPAPDRYSQNADNELNILDLGRQADWYGRNVNVCP